VIRIRDYGDQPDDLLASERAKDRMVYESSRLKSGSEQTAQQGQSDSQSDASNDTVLNKTRNVDSQKLSLKVGNLLSLKARM
jgi:hypothetical protein